MYIQIKGFWYGVMRGNHLQITEKQNINVCKKFNHSKYTYVTI